MLKAMFAEFIFVWVCLVVGCVAPEVEEDHDNFSSIQK